MSVVFAFVSYVLYRLFFYYLCLYVVLFLVFATWLLAQHVDERLNYYYYYFIITVELLHTEENLF